MLCSPTGCSSFKTALYLIRNMFLLDVCWSYSLFSRICTAWERLHASCKSCNLSQMLRIWSRKSQKYLRNCAKKCLKLLLNLYFVSMNVSNVILAISDFEITIIALYTHTFALLSIHSNVVYPNSDLPWRHSIESPFCVVFNSFLTKKKHRIYAPVNQYRKAQFQFLFQI